MGDLFNFHATKSTARQKAEITKKLL